MTKAPSERHFLQAAVPSLGCKIDLPGEPTLFLRSGLQPSLIKSSISRSGGACTGIYESSPDGSDVRPRGEVLLEGDSDNIGAWAQLVRGSSKRSLRSTTCSGKWGFLAFLNHSWQMLYLSGGCWGPTDMSGVPGVLWFFCLKQAQWYLLNPHLAKARNLVKTKPTKYPSDIPWFRGGRGWAHTPINIPVRCYWVGGMNRYYKVVNIIELPQVWQLVLQILKQKIYIVRELTSWRKLKESDPSYTRPSYLWPLSLALCTLCLCLRVSQRSTTWAMVREGRFCHWGRVGFQTDFPDSDNNWLKIHLLNCKCLHLLTLSHYIWRAILIGENMIY